jgi:hypothetical protein
MLNSRSGLIQGPSLREILPIRAGKARSLARSVVWERERGHVGHQDKRPVHQDNDRHGQSQQRLRKLTRITA